MPECFGSHPFRLLLLQLHRCWHRNHRHLPLLLRRLRQSHLLNPHPRLMSCLDPPSQVQLVTGSSAYLSWRDEHFDWTCDLGVRGKIVVLWWANVNMLIVGQALSYRLPSVSATVLPRRESAARLARLATGDSESSMASRLSNIISP